MDQNTAKRLFAEGAFFVLLDVPEGTEFGIDMKSWNTGEKFRGVKMIPPGIHFIFCNSVDSITGDVAPRVGFFHHFKKSEFLVKKWDKLSEEISNLPVDEKEIVALKENIRTLDNFLGPYPYEIWEKWQTLSANISLDIVERCTPLSGKIRSALELQSCTDADRPRGDKSTTNSSKSPKKLRLSEANDSDLLPDLKPLEGTELRFTQLPEKNYPDGSTAAEITRHCLDLTYTLDTMLSKYQQRTDILGELELTYICFLVGHSLEAFEHWKKLVNLFCSSELAIKKHRRLYDIFITLIEIQLSEMPEEFLADIVSNNNFIYLKLRELFRSVKNSSVDGQIKTKVERFMKKLVDKYLWDFEHLDSDDEDEAPVIVEM